MARYFEVYLSHKIAGQLGHSYLKCALAENNVIHCFFDCFKATRTSEKKEGVKGASISIGLLE